MAGADADRDHGHRPRRSPSEHVRPSEPEIAYLLDAVNAFFTTSFDAGDLVGAYAGVRPLIATGDPRKSVDISRKAELYETSSGMVTITGGKLTTWRRMAKETVDRIAWARRLGGRVPHARGAARAADRRRRTSVTRRRASISPPATGTWPTTCWPTGRLEPILPGSPDLLAEVAYAARREQARTVGDVLLRRTRLGLTAARGLLAPGAGAIERVADVHGGGAGVGSRAGRAREVSAFGEEAAKRASCPRRNFGPLRSVGVSRSPFDLEPLCHAVSSSR